MWTQVSNEERIGSSLSPHWGWLYLSVKNNFHMWGLVMVMQISSHSQSFLCVTVPLALCLVGNGRTRETGSHSLSFLLFYFLSFFLSHSFTLFYVFLLHFSSSSFSYHTDNTHYPSDIFWGSIFIIFDIFSSLMPLSLALYTLYGPSFRIPSVVFFFLLLLFFLNLTQVNFPTLFSFIHIYRDIPSLTPFRVSRRRKSRCGSQLGVESLLYDMIYGNGREIRYS